MYGRRMLGQCIPAIGDGRERIVFDLDQAGGVFGDVRIFRKHHRNCFADIDGLGIDQDHAVALLSVGLVRECNDQFVCCGMGSDVAGREYRDDARQRERRAFVDRGDGCMRMRASHEGGMQETRHSDVGDKLRFPAQQIVILDPSGRYSNGLSRARQHPTAPLHQRAWFARASRCGLLRLNEIPVIGERITLRQEALDQIGRCLTLQCAAPHFVDRGLVKGQRVRC